MPLIFCLIGSKHILYKKLITRDGHEAHIHRKRNALLMFRYQYHVTIRSKTVLTASAPGVVIYGWSGTDINKLVKEVRAWTTARIFKDNPYLLQAARQALLPAP